MKTAERLVLMTYIPQADVPFETLIFSKSIINKLSLTAEEAQEYGIKTLENGNIFINEKGNSVDKPMEFIEGELKVIEDCLKAHKEDPKLNMIFFDLYHQFVK